MSEGRLFQAALVLSIAAHAVLPFLPGETLVQAAELATQEREATMPMTVRIVEQETAPPPPVEPTPVDPLLTSAAGTRRVSALDLEPQRFERDREEAFDPLLAPVPLERELDEPEPLAEPIDVPLVAPPPELDAPERIDLPEPKRVVDDVDVALDEPTQNVEASAAALQRKASVDRSKNRAPRYPPQARARRLQGTCKLLCVIGADGRVKSVTVATSSGHEILDDAAVDAVRRWRFKPALGANGKAAEDTVLVPVTFRLTG
ncbi:MAG: energy transducer TonB [Planctomycetota bacterium]